MQHLLSLSFYKSSRLQCKANNTQEEQLMVDLIDTIVYAGRLKDKSALMSSSSGGAFTALSDFFKIYAEQAR